MTIWLIGMMFTFGLTIGDADDGDTWGRAVRYIIFVVVLWPLLLGAWVAITLKERTKDNQ